MGKMFGEKIGWVISAIFPAQLLGICIAEVLATATAFYALSGGAIPFAPHCIILAIILTIFYIFVGGLMQAAWMNLCNAFVLIVGSFIAVVYTGGWLSKSGNGGWDGVAEHYAQAGTAWKTSLLNFSPEVVFSLILPCLILTVFMQSASQVQNQPMLMARSESDIRRGVFWAAFINSFAAFPWVILGLVGMAMPMIAAKADAAKLSVPEFALMAFPPWLVGILMTSLLAATLSTTGGLILGASHIIVHDIFKRAVNPGMSDRTFLILTRTMIIVCALLVIIPALRNPGIMPLLYWVFSFAVPVFGVYLIGMLWKVNKVAAWTTLLAGYFANFYWTFAEPTWLPSYLSLNVYPTIFATLLFGIGLNLILPGEPGYLRQLKAKKNDTPG
jgi:SSS family solute:Na+ symporter